MAVLIRILFFITLLVAVVRTHKHSLKATGHSNKHLHKSLGTLGCFEMGKSRVEYMRNYRQKKRIFAKGVNRKCDRSYDIFTEISKCNGAGNYDKSIDTILNVAKGCGGIIDYSFNGLGSLFSNLVIASHRIIFCVLKHKHSKHSLCSDNDYGNRWGWKRYSGHYNDIGSVIKCYKLENCQSDVEELLKKLTNGKEWKVLKGTKKLIAEAIWHIAGLFKRDYKHWCIDDARSIFLKVVTIAGALANSHRSGLGDEVVDGLTSYCSDFFKELGCSDISTSTTNIKKDLEECDKEDFNGAITYDNSEDSYNENNSKSNANASSQQSTNNEETVAASNKNDNINSQATNIVVNNYIVYDDEHHDHDKDSTTEELEKKQ